MFLHDVGAPPPPTIGVDPTLGAFQKLYWRGSAWTLSPRIKAAIALHIFYDLKSQTN